MSCTFHTVNLKLVRTNFVRDEATTTRIQPQWNKDLTGICSTALVSESLSVVHITDDGMSIIQPLKITETHVVVHVPHLSAFGIVWDLMERFKKFMTQPIRGQTLLFLRRVHLPRYILSLILLPSNVPLKDVKLY